MALLKCKACGHDVNSDTKLCPNCSAKISKFRIGNFGRILILFISIFLISHLHDPTQNSQSSKASDQERERKFQHDVIILKALKQSLNNPNSFQLVQAIRLNNDTLCVTIRGTNAFNAIITVQKAINSNGQFVDYEQICNAQPGEDISYIKEAI